MFDVTLLILLGLAALGFISHNTTVAVSILVLIIVRVTPLSTFFPWIEKQGLSIGIIILTIGVMAPIASGDATALNLDSLVSELEIAGGNCSRRYCLLAGWARRDLNGQPAATGRRAAGRHCFRRGAVSRRTGRPAYCRGSGFADCGETVVNPAIYRPGVCPRPFLNIVIKAVVESYPSV